MAKLTIAQEENLLNPSLRTGGTGTISESNNLSPASRDTDKKDEKILKNIRYLKYAVQFLQVDSKNRHIKQLLETDLYCLEQDCITFFVSLEAGEGV